MYSYFNTVILTVCTNNRHWRLENRFKLSSQVRKNFENFYISNVYFLYKVSGLDEMFIFWLYICTPVIGQLSLAHGSVWSVEHQQGCLNEIMIKESIVLHLEKSVSTLFGGERIGQGGFSGHKTEIRLGLDSTAGRMKSAPFLRREVEWESCDPGKFDFENDFSSMIGSITARRTIQSIYTILKLTTQFYSGIWLFRLM